MVELGDKYKLGKRIGGGGMADVFRATTHGAEGFSRPVAIKRIKKSISNDKGFGKLFVDEARLAASLNHPNVVQTIDFDKDSHGRFYLVMELIEGIDLRKLVSSGRIPVQACVFIAIEILRALDYAHELVDAGGRRITIVHRDISPHNIMLGWQGVVKVVDFGIAKAIERSLVSRSGSLKGKVSYMSPEQVHGHSLDGRSDLFALGIILHEILTGSRLFVDKTEAATLSRLLTQPIPRPSATNDQIPPDLDNIVMRLLERDRTKRFTRAKDAMDALLQCSIGSKGRLHLETVLGERFATSAPKRVARLSSSSGESETSDRYEIPSALRSADSPMGSAETLAARPASASRTIPEQYLIKKTLTSAPALSFGENQMGQTGPSTVKRTLTAESAIDLNRRHKGSTQIKQTLKSLSPVDISAAPTDQATETVSQRPPVKRTQTASPAVDISKILSEKTSEEINLAGVQPKRTETASPAVDISKILFEKTSQDVPGPPAAPEPALSSEELKSFQRNPMGKWIALGLVAAALAGGAFLFVRSQPSTAASNDPIKVVKVTPSIDATQSKEAKTPPTTMDAGLAAADARSRAPSATTPKTTHRDSPETSSHKQSASVTIRVKPWAIITIDGKRYGQTPQSISLRPGKHRLVLTNADLDTTLQIPIALKSGQTKLIEKDFR